MFKKPAAITGTTAMTTLLDNRAGRRTSIALVAATATFLSTSLATTASFAEPRYDGLWSVLVMTQKGDCDPGYRYPIRIANGALVNAGDNAFTITGKVAPTGSITVTVSAGGKSATGLGRLSGDMGGGSWSGGSCSGQWTAERRGA
jgi:hypothetical protein